MKQKSTFLNVRIDFRGKKIELIKRFFNISKREALEIEDLISDNDMEKIKIELSTGGINNEQSK